MTSKIYIKQNKAKYHFIHSFFLFVYYIMKLPAILKNKYVVMVAAVFAVLNVVGYVTSKAWECLVLFAATAYSVQCYTKNVVVGILAGLFVANFVFGCGRIKENFDAGDLEGMLKKAAKTAENMSECPKGKVKKDGKCVDDVEAGEAQAGFKVMADQLEELSKHAGDMMDKVGLSDVMSKVSNMVKMN